MNVNKDLLVKNKTLEQIEDEFNKTLTFQQIIRKDNSGIGTAAMPSTKYICLIAKQIDLTSSYTGAVLNTHIFFSSDLNNTTQAKGVMLSLQRSTDYVSHIYKEGSNIKIWNNRDGYACIVYGVYMK